MERIIGIFRTLDKILKDEEDPIEQKTRQAVESIEMGNIKEAERGIQKIKLLKKLRKYSIFDLKEFNNMDGNKILETVQKIFLEIEMPNSERNVYSLRNAITYQTVAYRLIQDRLYDVANEAIDKSVKCLEKIR